jgi:hypothetical protein
LWNLAAAKPGQRVALWKGQQQEYAALSPHWPGVSLSPSESSEDEAVADAVNGFIMASQGHGISERMHVRVCAFAFQSDLQ